MYSFLQSGSSLYLKNQVRENIFSLLGNCGKTLHSQSQFVYAEISLPWYQAIQKVIHDVWVTPYKKVSGYCLILLSATMIAPPSTSFAVNDIEKTFSVTAYYSPLPGQSFYLKGNYEAETRLNGNGTNGASGAPVFTGMIAAPKSYSFGTHIFFPGLGVGTVEDRGGAIVDAFSGGQAYDRIDIWMGQGESGLKRALLWGRREVKGTFVSDTSNMNSIDLEGIDNGRVNITQYKKIIANSAGGISSDVLSTFADLGYVVTANGVKSMITSFQIDHNVILSKDDDGAGTYGPKTRAALAAAHVRYTLLHNLEQDAIDAARKQMLDERTAWNQRYSIAQKYVSYIGSPRIGDRGNNVAILQTVLKGTGFFQGKSTGVMGGTTVIALKKYQKSRGLAQTGKIDINTQLALAEDAMEA